MIRAAVLSLALSGCAMTVGPNSLCDIPRPSYVSGDTEGTIARQRAAAAMWDRRCTLLGAWHRVTKP
jgi:hypothetical protein